MVRSPAFGTNGSQTGAIVEPVSNVVILTESSIEKKLVRSLLADNNVVSVRHQALLVTYVDQDGVTRDHTVDIVATMRDGSKVGYVVKPEASASKRDTRGFVERLAPFVPQSKLDRIQLVTSRQLPEWGNQNARKVLNARRDRRGYVDDLLREIAPELEKPVRIGDLTARLGGGDVAFRPVLRAIHYGTLIYLGFGTIDEKGLVKFSGAIMPDTDRLGPVPDLSNPEPPVILLRKTKPKSYRRASFRKH
ncbi:hypothetical protein JI749_10205 [Devosia oryziradicis]|uniref:Uncharacterized protein n=1 Tax=Devosia oryziradicis TaxID=2801335 RepID=A0ABX7BS37_9HYPH|nr:hypothetical protein [Devosia oryziradicis]QQR34759.1 hypothetical protein JI749_10205 [Devosia oryziradicis]